MTPAVPTSDHRPSGCAQELVSTVATERQAEALYAEIMGDRTYGIVGLTCRAGKRDPALPVERVREKIWPTVPIYVIEPRESRILNDLLPDRLGAYNGAVRVWWPGADQDTEPSFHPLIYDSTGFYGEAALERLAAEFALNPPEFDQLSPQEQAALRLRSAPRPAASSDRARDSALLVLATRKDLRRLTSDLRGADRDAIVVLTLGDRADGPSFPPSAIRAGVDPHVPVYVVATADLCRRLEQSLGPQLAVRGGDARIYWPGVSHESDPAEHPLVPAHSNSDRRDPSDRLMAALDLSRPGVRGHVAVTQERLEAAEQRAADTLRELRESRAECATEVARAKAAEAELADAQQKLDALHAAGLDRAELELVARMGPEATMHRLISREWAVMLQSADFQKHPLGNYVLGPQFIKSIEDKRIATPRARIAFACAVVSCRMAKTHGGLEPHPLRAGDKSGDDPQAVRADGAKGMVCNLGHGMGAARLIYWVLPDGKTEFEALRNHDAIGHA